MSGNGSGPLRSLKWPGQGWREKVRLDTVPSGVAELRQGVQPVATEARLGHRSPPHTLLLWQTSETVSDSQLSRVKRGLEVHVSASWLGHVNLK